MKSHSAALVRLSETALVLADDTLDIRGRNVIDPSGSAIGHVQDLFIDESERKVRMLQIRAGGFLGLGDRHFLLPIDAIASVSAKDVLVNEMLDRIVGSPVYDPKLEAAPTLETWGPYYGYYGMAPFWGLDYMYPRFSIERGDDLRHGPDVRHDRFIR